MDSTAVCGDPRLGPKNLPVAFPLSNELETYSRFGELCPFEFLEKWTLDASDPKGYWIYPDSDGFAQTPKDVSILGNYTLRVGRSLIDSGPNMGIFWHLLELHISSDLCHHPIFSRRPIVASRTTTMSTK